MVSVCDVVWIWCSGKCVVFRVCIVGRARLAGQKVGRWFLLFGVVGGDGDAAAALCACSCACKAYVRCDGSTQRLSAAAADAWLGSDSRFVGLSIF